MPATIKGVIPVTMLDWDGKLATTLFVGGCNYRCPFCHNADLVLSPESLPDIEWEKVEEHLKAKKLWIDGICISGGEPTIHPDLPGLLEKIKNLGFAVKLDTNGARPDVLRKLIRAELIDYLAMDIKTSFEKYSQAVKTSADIAKIKESINLIFNLSIDYEFRTTVVPTLVNEEDVLKIANYIKGAKVYVLQQFFPRQILDPEMINLVPYPKEVLLAMAEKCNEIVATKVRG